jgi:hypothetical protein
VPQNSRAAFPDPLVSHNPFNLRHLPGEKNNAYTQDLRHPHPAFVEQAAAIWGLGGLPGALLH